MSSRVFSYRSPGYGDLKSASAILIDNVGGLNRASGACRLGMSSLSDCINPSKPHRHLPVDVVLQLEAAANSSIVTAHLASRLGLFLCQPVPLKCGLNEVVKETGEVLGVIGEKLSNKNLSTDVLLRELEDAINAMASVHATLTNGGGYEL